jgi:hypothetical protein
MFRAHKNAEVEESFMAIAKDLKATYLFVYRPPVTGTGEWRPIQVVLRGGKEIKNLRLRHKEGYFAD